MIHSGELKLTAVNWVDICDEPFVAGIENILLASDFPSIYLPGRSECISCGCDGISQHNVILGFYYYSSLEEPL